MTHYYYGKKNVYSFAKYPVHCVKCLGFALMVCVVIYSPVFMSICQASDNQLVSNAEHAEELSLPDKLSKLPEGALYSTELIVHLYRFAILEFTKRYRDLYFNKSPDELEKLFKEEVLSILSIVDPKKWNLPRFVSSNKDKDKNFIVNLFHSYNNDDDLIRAQINSSIEDDVLKETEMKRYKTNLSKNMKYSCIQELQENASYVEEVNDDYIVAVNLIPNKNGTVRNQFEDGNIKKYCMSCHIRIINSKNKRKRIDESILNDLDKIDLHNLNGALVFKVPTEISDN